MNSDGNGDGKGHLPLFGVGPIYVFIIATLTILAVPARKLPTFASGRLEGIDAPLDVLGIILILAGIFMWIQSVIVSRLDENIKENRLVTTGIYVRVRNLIYSSFMIMCLGMLLIVGNIWFLALQFIYWLLLTLMMKCTEEKWLKDLYGQEYEAYCKRVNRCWPWIPRKGKRDCL